MRQDIHDFASERLIPYLLHFTRAENLPSILANGLAPRAMIDANNIVGHVNDDLRLDRRRDYNCLSISFPNHLMLYRFQLCNPGVDWPIIVIRPAVISNMDALFCNRNAASNGISQSPAEALSRLDAFRGLFDEHENLDSRAEQSLKPCDPTDVQAEILVRGVIPAEEIYHVIFPSAACQSQYAKHLGGRNSTVSNRQGFYGTRRYFRTVGIGK